MSTSQDEATTTEEHVAPPEAWDAIAEGYDRYVAPQEVELANEALRLVGLGPGERFLDVAAGTGGLSLPAARLGAEVLATDWSPAMIERFEARVREEGLSNAEGRVMDCHALDLPDDSFDVTGSQFGVMLVPDQPRALREMVRVTKPGGRVLVIAYGSPDGARVPPVLHRRAEGRRSRVPGPPGRSASARVPGGRSGGLAPAADRRRTKGRPRRADGRAASVRLGAGDVGLGAATATRSRACWSQTSARSSERDCARSSTACSASAPGRTGEPCSRTRSTSASGRSEVADIVVFGTLLVALGVGV